MNAELAKELDGRVPLVVVLQDVPEMGDKTTFFVLGLPVKATIGFHEIGATMIADGVALTREQAIDFAVRITEAVGRFD